MRTRILLSCGFFVLAARAHAAPVASVFGGRASWTTESSGVKVRQGAPGSRVESWDGVPLNANVALPPPAMDGPSPLMVRTLAALDFSGCAWISLGVHAAGYRVTAAGEAGNVVVNGRLAYVSLAQQGLEIIDPETDHPLKTMPPPAGSESIDDLAVAEGLLFVLDAQPPGHLSVYSVADPATPVLRSAPVEVPVGPFSGVSAAAGRVIVSGGTSELTLRTYDPDGRLGSDVVKADLGRGQPDVLLAPDGDRAFVSTHFRGPKFGLTTVHVTSAPLSVITGGTLDLETIGFTAGGAKPANFPIEAALTGDVLLVAYVRGLALVDVSDLDQPNVLNEIPLDVKPVNVDVRDGTAAVVGSSPKPMLSVIDVKNPAAPRVIRSVPLPEGSYASGVAIASTHIVVAGGAKGALVFPR